MIAVPVLNPVTIPVAVPTVATDGPPLDHDPPGSESLSVVVAPLQIDVLPAIGAGNGFTVMITAEIHPAALV